MIKLKHIILESSIRKKYIDSLKSNFPEIKISNGKDESSFIILTIKSENDGKPKKIKRFITNHTFNVTDVSPNDKIKKHDADFIKKHNLKVTGRHDKNN